MPLPIYNDTYLQALFDEMQGSYERVSNITSFGFNLRWRQQLVQLLHLQTGMHVGDLMAGSGETWVYVLPEIDETGTLTAVDFSQRMVEEADKRKTRLRATNVRVLHENALCSSIENESVDVLLCVYGVKTLSVGEREAFAHEVQRLLKPGGMFGLIEVSVPSFKPLARLYLFYLGQIVPLIGKLLLGNPDNYRMLGAYVSAFGDCRPLESVFSMRGFCVQFHSFFGGCATALTGTKPLT